MKKINANLLMVFSAFLGFSVSSTALAANNGTNNHVYGSVGYSKTDIDNKYDGYHVKIGDRVGIADNQSIKVEGEFGQTKKKNNLKMENYGVKTNYEYAVPVSDNFYLIPNVGVGYKELKINSNEVKSKVKSTYGEVGVRAQTQVGDVIVMPEVAYTKDFQTKLSSDTLGNAKIKKGNGWRVGVQNSVEVGDMNNYAVTFGVQYEEHKNKSIATDKIKKTSVELGLDF